MSKSESVVSSDKELESVLERMRHYCAYQERCISEVNQKLSQWKIYGETRIKIVTLLMKESFIDEERFARIFVRSKFHINKWGRSKIRYELKSRIIPEPLINKAMEEIGDDDYLKTIKELVQKKHTEINNGKHLNIREKIITFVTGKGYEYDLILKVLTELKI